MLRSLTISLHRFSFIGTILTGVILTGAVLISTTFISAVFISVAGTITILISVSSFILTGMIPNSTVLV
ncbi:hypothetical protein FACS1894129_8500 [Actinomycetota bacterium]|nr:hypothetical protein FACS1894129_8500 [Actinomycetota bacterium]